MLADKYQYKYHYKYQGGLSLGPVRAPRHKTDSFIIQPAREARGPEGPVR